MVHLSDLDWNRPGEQVIEEYNKGDMVKAVVLDVDVEKERISLGIKQLGKDAVGDAAASGDLRKNAGRFVRSSSAVNDGGIEVKLVNHEDLTSFIRRADLSRDRDEQRPERFAGRSRWSTPASLNFSKKDRKVQAVDQGSGNRRREGSRRTVRFVRLRALRSATSSAQP